MYDTDFDTQKLMCHPREVAEWLTKGVTKGPIYTEMELTRRCNLRCIFCGVDYQVNKTDDVIDPSLAGKIVADLHALGNKAIMFSGHGEPLLHPQAADIIAFASERMSTSVTTNGSTLSEDKTHLIDGLQWIRFSINAGTRDVYADVHRTTPDTFDRVMSNLTRVVERKRALGLDVVVGTQLVLLDENADTAVELCRRVKEIGADYFSAKPYSQHPLSENRQAVDYESYRCLGHEIASFEDASFKVIYRTGSMAKVGASKQYGRCYGTHFLCFISSNGDVWECNSYAGDPRFWIGSACEEDLAAIWTGPRRKQVLALIENGLDVGDCRGICRMDECNKYLWRLKNPWPHDDFI